jgi:tetratricopeptide (TPR) repeat protein
VDEGLAMHTDTLEIRKKVMGDTNNDTGVSYYGVACVYQKLGRLDDALTSVTNAIEIFTQVPGAEDRISRSYYRKHLILKEMGQDENAGVALSEARRFRQELIGQETRGDTMREYDSLVSYYNK